VGKFQNKKLVISKNISSPLQNVPFHSRNDDIERVMPQDFPIYLAVHAIRNSRSESTRKYVELHTHDVPELNILIGDNDTLKYEIQTDTELHKVESPASVYIPSGVAHAANHISGKGYYMCIILSDIESAFAGKGEKK
jgi:hypothetical protein